MIDIEEIKLEDINTYWDLHINYLIDDEIISDEEDIEYFSGSEYRDAIIFCMMRDKDKHHLIYFLNDGKRIGCASYCLYEDEDYNCFILDFWIFKEYRNKNLGHLCFKKLEDRVKAKSYEINSSKENSIRFWSSLGFIENGLDEYGEKLFIKNSNS